MAVSIGNIKIDLLARIHEDGESFLLGTVTAPVQLRGHNRTLHVDLDATLDYAGELIQQAFTYETPTWHPDKFDTPLGCTVVIDQAPEHLGDGVLLRLFMWKDNRGVEVYLDQDSIEKLKRALP